MHARDVMSRDVVTVEQSATLLEAVKLLINTQLTVLPVVDGTGSLVGILSEFDLIRHVIGSDSETLSRFQTQLEDDGALAEAYARVLAGPVTGIMTRSVVTASEDTDLKSVADLMLKHQTRRIPIVRGDSVVGVVSRADLVKALLSRPTQQAEAAVPAGAAVGDDQLRRDVTTAVRKLGVPLGGGFDIVVHGGVVHLWGEVFDEEANLACRSAAARVPGVSDVYNHMQVISPMRRLLRRGW